MGLFSEMMDESGELKNEISRLRQILGSIARGHNGKPITGKDAQARARDCLTELGVDWRSSPLSSNHQTPQRE